MTRLQPALQPPPLRPGSRLALIAPAGPMLVDRIPTALEPYLSAGYQIISFRDDLGRQSNAPDYLAGSDEIRLKELLWALTDPSIDGILCGRGGYGSQRLLLQLREQIQPHLPLSPKILVGFSDITALHAFCFFELGWSALHAPLVFNFAPIPPATGRSSEQNLSWKWLQSALEGSRASVPFTPSEQTPTKGVLIGGNLSLIDALYRTPFLPSLRGAILALEDVGEASYKLDRMISSLQLRGAHLEVEAVLLGSFNKCGDLSDLEGSQHAADCLREWNVPVLQGAAFGHLHPQRPLWIGSAVEIDPPAGQLHFIENNRDE